MARHDYDRCSCGGQKLAEAERCRTCWDSRPVTSPHGTRARYSKGCRCDDCRVANTAYLRRWRAGRGREAVGEVREFRVQLPAGWGL